MNKKYTQEDMKKMVRDMFRGLGVDVPDKIPRRQVVVHDKHGNITKSYWIGEESSEDNDGETVNGDRRMRLIDHYEEM